MKNNISTNKSINNSIEKIYNVLLFTLLQNIVKAALCEQLISTALARLYLYSYFIDRFYCGYDF